MATKEKIEKKISDCIDAIIRKEHIDYQDYQTLTAELSRIKADEAAAKYEAEKEERDAKMQAMLGYTFGFGGAK